ncbi:MAG: PTS sugar transporter subunit IIB [Deltaproteobacteria bacterium]|jgi:PTS system mannose-specific IIB component|nr:PTS sugar transporter subunit IIB [Deltaproteobacteria bacterium]
MSIVLARIDSRLVHGQVLEAWVPHVKADCIVVANDEVAGVSFQRAVMEAAVPSSIKLVIGTLEEAVRILSSAELLKKRVLLLFSNSEDALELRQLGVIYDKLNLGNMHSSSGKDRYSCTIALDTEDINNLQKIEGQGVSIVCQCVPADRERTWHKLIQTGAR